MLCKDRSAKVFVTALISIVIGALVLKTLGSNPLNAGAFSLSEYYQLGPVERVISSNIARTSRNWDSIEISYTNTKLIAVNEQFSPSDLVNHDVLNYHFIVWNGLIGEDGQIQSTARWQRQLSTTPDDAGYGGEQTIHIGVIVDSTNTHSTDLQTGRTEMLVQVLSRRLGIQPASICYPDNWGQWRTWIKNP